MPIDEDEIIAGDRTQLYSWRSEVDDARADIMLVHGFCEHSGRYRLLTDWLNSRGYSVDAYDQRGHGRSGGLKGHVDRFADYEDDLDTVISSLNARNGMRKRFLIGHSMGGLVVLRYLARARQSIAGAVISAPLLGLAVRPPQYLRIIGRIAAALAPRLRLNNNINPSVLSRDPEVGRIYASDPLVGRRVSANWFSEAVKGMEEAGSLAPTIAAPLLIMHGTADKLASIEATKKVFSNIGSSDKELVIYDGFYHELFNEPEKREIYERLTEWLDVRSERV